MRKQVIATGAILIALALAFVLAVIVTSAPAKGSPSYTAWENEGSPEQTVENAPPGPDTEFERWLPVGTTEVGNGDATEDEEVFDHWQRYSWNGDWNRQQPPPFPHDRWQANVQGDPHGIGVAGPYFRSHGNSGGGDWFYLEAVTKTVEGQDETFHTEYLWQRQVRRIVPFDLNQPPRNPETDPPATKQVKPKAVVGTNESACVGGALVTKFYDAAGVKTATETVNGHPRCEAAPGEVQVEEGM